MVKHFYSFLVETESLFIEIEALSISGGEKKHLKSLAESHIHHSILDSILSELDALDKKVFLDHLNTRNHEKVWTFLHNKVDDAEKKIQDAAESIKKELHHDIKDIND